ncbi:hypothetical protein BCR37DRAFT_388567 [Protomyces lactucae-debilis]|uniref:Uncharacterized protein n=1 Tax=Protomyces lactucae-debilis TaxID=2754530 RepID=A0A1Y2F4T8_PROLT|nr:uncharacterized protein BCR37DRAFT_388567 [Protomyces lactucae-debilis]ORY78938.1 hypothetical protein BCR37DRAFT_388567 [Protomyces lactucae-debilis]
MQFLNILLNALALASAVVVEEPPTTTTPPMVCNRDNCLRAAIASGAKPGPVTAGLECAAFVGSQQPVTITTISGTVQTISPSPTGPLTSTISRACGNSPSRYLSACMCRGYTRSTVTKTSSASATVSEFASGCNADNCERGIFGTNADNQNVPSRLNDCTSFLASKTVFVGDGGGGTATGVNDVPSYATSACQGDSRARYESVCRCIGVAEATETVNLNFPERR